MASPRPSPSADARERLLHAAVQVFGRQGFAGTSTRELAGAAGVNLQAITYHFGGKEGLYLATADHIADRILAQIKPARERARARLAGGRVGPDEARALLAAVLGAFAGVLFDDAWAPVVGFVVREQMEPTEAFDRLYKRVMEPQLEVARRIVGILLGENPRSVRVRLRTLSVIGSILFFRIARAGAMRQLGWKRTGRREVAAIHELIRDTAAAVTTRKPA